MGDSGALLLGFLLATISVQGLLKTAATVALFFPLLVLAVPITRHVVRVAKRLKYGQPLYAADQTHLHYRFLNIGFSQRRAALYHLRVVRDARRGGARDALPPVPRARRLAPVADARAPARSASLALAASVYIVFLLEIVKLVDPAIRRREEAARAGRGASAAVSLVSALHEARRARR